MASVTNGENVGKWGGTCHTRLEEGKHSEVADALAVCEIDVRERGASLGELPHAAVGDQSTARELQVGELLKLPEGGGGGGGGGGGVGEGWVG